MQSWSKWKKHKKKKQIFYQGLQHILQIIGCINNLNIHFCLKRTTNRNSNLTFVCPIFLSRKCKKNSYNLEPLFWIYQITFSLAFPTISIQTSFIQIWPFFNGTHHCTLTILKNSFWSSLITSLCVLPNQIGTRKGSWSFTGTKSPLLRSLNGVYVGASFKFLGP